MSTAFTYTNPVYCCQSVAVKKWDSRFVGYWERCDDKLNNIYGLFSNTYLAGSNAKYYG
jgi:hypothetical protein